MGYSIALYCCHGIQHSLSCCHGIQHTLSVGVFYPDDSQSFGRQPDVGGIKTSQSGRRFWSCDMHKPFHTVHMSIVAHVYVCISHSEFQQSVLGAGVEMEIAKIIEHNTTLRKFGLSFSSNGPPSSSGQICHEEQ